MGQNKKIGSNVCQFLGEDYSPALLDYHKTEHCGYSDRIIKPDAIKTHEDHDNNRNWQINQPIFDGRGRWLTEMTEAEKDLFKNSPAQPLLEFYQEYNELPKLQPLVREISWAKNLVILARAKDPLEREFYLRATARFGWTKAVLQHQIDNQSYQKYLLNQTHFDQALPDEIKAQATLAVKDHYTFDFLELAEEHSERPLEHALVANLRQFLAELGGAFAFIGNPYRLEVGGQDYFIDLLLFHRRLRCLVAIELKMGDFLPEHKGKMEFYLEALDAQERLTEENPPIGIIICRGKNKTIVEYALRTASRPLGVASYSIAPQLPKDYQDDLPSPESIAQRLEQWQQDGPE